MDRMGSFDFKCFSSHLILNLHQVRNPRDSDFHGTTTNKRIKLSRTQLQQYDGTNPDLPIYIAIRGKVYSVGKDNPHYKPGGQYHSFAGREPNMGLAKNSTSAEHITHEISGITASEFEVLKHWAELFSNKYLCVGEIVEEDAQNPQIHPVA
eukprot:TRINITY_DN5409_c0_g1_i1.p1 TRINITY_DN5409_c0_g1~~TRINITY_DN5409_c0_g1_i1.p1  ORF type:complete len:152 (+),score=25.61 TRINITY_DN5409_c0_g1_i1:29-484(+)